MHKVDVTGNGRKVGEEASACFDSPKHEVQL